MKLMTLISCIASLACVGFAERLLSSRRGHREREGCIANGSQLAPNPSDRDKMSVVSCQQPIGTRFVVTTVAVPDAPHGIEV